MFVSPDIVLFFHLIFIWLSIGAFFWNFRGFLVRSLFWVLVTGGMVFRAISLGRISSSELIEIPMLSIILMTVFFIASRRSQSQRELERKNAELEQALTERDQLQQALERQAFFDPLTGLPNRVLFYDRLRQSIAHAARHHDFVAVLFLDLDGFKSVNDRFGHANGDNILIQVAERIQSQMRAEDTVARLGGDEFTILLGNETSAESAGQVASRLLDELAKPFTINGQDILLTVSIGISVNAPGKTQPDDMVSEADHAMYEVKAQGKAGFKVFDRNELLAS